VRFVLALGLQVKILGLAIIERISQDLYENLGLEKIGLKEWRDCLSRHTACTDFSGCNKGCAFKDVSSDDLQSERLEEKKNTIVS
jgi:hypothetical protein